MLPYAISGRKYHRNAATTAGPPPRTPLGELTVFPVVPAKFERQREKKKGFRKNRKCELGKETGRKEKYV